MPAKTLSPITATGRATALPDRTNEHSWSGDRRLAALAPAWILESCGTDEETCCTTPSEATHHSVHSRRSTAERPVGAGPAAISWI